MKILHKNLPRLVRLAADWKIKGNSIVLPQHYVPDGVVVGSDEYKIFLFYFCFLTPRSHSSVLIKKIDLLIKDGIKVERLFDELTLTSERHIPFFKRQIGWMKKCQESLGGIEIFQDLIVITNLLMSLLSPNLSLAGVRSCIAYIG